MYFGATIELAEALVVEAVGAEDADIVSTGSIGTPKPPTMCPGHTEGREFVLRWPVLFAVTVQVPGPLESGATY